MGVENASRLDEVFLRDQELWMELQGFVVELA